MRSIRLLLVSLFAFTSSTVFGGAPQTFDGFTLDVPGTTSVHDEVRVYLAVTSEDVEVPEEEVPYGIYNLGGTLVYPNSQLVLMGIEIGDGAPGGWAINWPLDLQGAIDAANATGVIGVLAGDFLGGTPLITPDGAIRVVCFRFCRADEEYGCNEYVFGFSDTLAEGATSGFFPDPSYVTVRNPKDTEFNTLHSVAPDLGDDNYFGGEASEAPFSFIRGDVGDILGVNLTDAVLILTSLFLGDVLRDCEAAADANNDGVVNITDAVTILVLLFQSGIVALPPPYPDLGFAEEDSVLDCNDGGLCA